ncbi:MAG: putative manganese-dependent inorganic diphosphatase [Lachnospiraceae bacterium]|nr:putative manganese-dependent inorganic diphosphatase [Lachnospiraceae bacterium]MBR7016600.1 putative manganese-dependent inorganic diphosphatase [Lachnospiraceae bacterium]
MTSQDPVYITGHQHPDTDSIASAIAYSFFKRSMGIRAIPCRLGSVNAESAWLLKRFGFEEPMLLTDARVRLSDITLDPPTFIKPDTTIFESLRQMEEQGHTYCGVVDDEMHLLGLVTKGDIAQVGLGDTHHNIDILSKTPLDNFVKTLDGKLIYRDDEMHLNGKVSMIAMAEIAQLDAYQIEDRIVILGSSSVAQRHAIERGAGLLIIVWANSVEPDVIELAKAHHCPIIISGHGAMNTSRYIYFAPAASTIMKTNIVTFTDIELAEDVGKKMLRSRFHIYPVINTERKLVGYVARYHIMNCKNKQIILVDHNEFSQSVRAIEKARVLEVIDHHRINDFSTTQPVAFRNEIVGSSATIVSTIFRENQIPIPQNLAGLLLGALLSDTMNFHSPTTTPKDIQTANILAAMADLDIEEFARDMFAVTANTSGKTYSEMINQDMKIYDIKECKLAISQVIVTSTKALREDDQEIQQAVESFAAKKRLDLSVLVFTSIMENGSIIYAGGNRAAWIPEAFPNRENEEHSFQQDLLSRKKQILPKINDVIDKYM